MALAGGGFGDGQTFEVQSRMAAGCRQRAATKDGGFVSVGTDITASSATRKLRDRSASS
jgi:hypothetical protein